MYSVGILSGQGKWPEVLSEMLKTSGSNVSGWINPQVSSPFDTQQLIDFSDLIWIPEKISGSMEEAIQVIRRSRHLSLGIPIVHGLGKVPVICYNSFGVGSELVKMSELYSIAVMNWTVFNLSSEIRALERGQTFSVFCIQTEGAGAIKIGIDNDSRKSFTR